MTKETEIAVRDLELEDMFSKMSLIRAFEQKLLDLFSAGELMGTTHTCLGQEVNAVGVASAMRRTDTVISNHRGHGHFLAHIGDVDGLMAEIMGKSSGVCGGWGGSQHICIPDKFYSNGIQGGTVPLGVGLALARKYNALDGVVVVFVGDGTLGQGVVYESLNLASLHSAPIVFIVEANGIAQTTPTSTTLAGTMAARADAFGIACMELSYPGPFEVKKAASEFIERARSGGGPAMLIIESVRLGAHSKGDDSRSELEIAKLKEQDPLKKMEATLASDIVSKAWSDAQIIVDNSVEVARAAPFPELDPSPPHVDSVVVDADELLKSIDGKTQREVINSGLQRLLSVFPESILLGEDIIDPIGGAFKVSAGLSTAYPEQVWPMPISEAAMVGVAGGLALGGVKPVVEIMFGDFLGLTMDQIVNHLACYRGMYNNQVAVPALIRTPMGGRRGYGPTHSQSLEKHFLGIPGLDVLAPSPLHPSGEMLVEAMQGEKPTLFIENKLAYGYRVNRSQDGMVDDFHIKRTEGNAAPWILLSLTEFEDEEATLITYGGMVPLVMEAAHKALLENDLSVRILAPGKLSPLDGFTLRKLIAENGSALCIEEASCAYGFGSEVAAVLMEAGRRCYRLGAKGITIGASAVLEDQILPSVNEIHRAIVALRGHS